MQNSNRNEAELVALKQILAEALATGSDAEVLSARRAISRYYRGHTFGLGLTGLADLNASH